MRASAHEVQDLSRLASLEGETLHAVFRRAMANLAAHAEDRLLPLEGIDPQALLESVRHALAQGLFEDLSWMADASSLIAVYELMLALPPSDERNALSRYVAELVANSNASTFVPLAAALALGATRALSTARMRSRVALAISLPLGVEPRADALALALIEQSEYAREWVDEPSKGSLPARRLAARVLERAAIEAVRRLQRKDDAGIRILETPVIKAAWDRLLQDREPLVWRHVAVARGLLASVVPRLAEEIESSIALDKTTTEWRRGATSLAASIAMEPKKALSMAQEMLATGLLQRDQGVAAAMMFGLARAGQLQPQAAERLLVPLLRAGGMQAIEAFIDVREERVLEGFGREAAQHAAALIKEALNKPEIQTDDGTVALLEWMLERVTGKGKASIERAVTAALDAFVSEGAGRAVELASDALDLARKSVAIIGAQDLDTREGRMATARLLLDLDQALLSSSVLSDLCGLGADAQASLEQLHQLFEDLSAWMLSVEQAPVADANIPHIALRMRRIRTMLHLFDADGSFDRSNTLLDERKPRRLRAVRVLLSRGMHEAESPLRRALIACLARVFDGLVREGVFELSDVLVCASLYLRDPSDINVLAEATMLPELALVLSPLSELARKTVGQGDSITVRRESIAALLAVVNAMPVSSSPRVAVLRWTLLRTQLALDTLYSVRAQAELVDPEGGNTLAELSEALQALAQLVAGARRRLSPNAQIQVPSVGSRLRALGIAFETAVQQRSPQGLTEPFDALDACVGTELPAPFGTAIMRVLTQLKSLPREVSVKGGKTRRVTLPGAEERSLPAWLPPNRLLGGFYVLHALGEGGVGSVFVARRAEEKDDENAPVFALKVPEYDGAVAQILSEADFLRLFREEAGALLALPDNEPNIAGFVTFDAGVKPKPILVMEHVEGPSLERLLARRHMDLAQAFDILAGIAQGLEAMHHTGLAHLDVKPSNVILRGFWDGEMTPVLVDFGLSGRRLRPGCGTPNYAAPEIWGQGGDPNQDPRPADVYAFGCVAYELLTGATLFDAETDMAIVSAHINHDGSPGIIQSLNRDLGWRPLGEFFTSCLRQKASARATISELLRKLPFLRAELEDKHWPLDIGQQTARASRLSRTGGSTPG